MSIDERDQAEKCTVYLKAVADPTRLQIVRALRTGPLTVSDIALLVEVDMTTVSHHLRVLYHANITVTKRDGKYIYYSLNPELTPGKRQFNELDFGCCKLDLRHTSTSPPH